MTPDDKKSSPERAQTDESLRTEREETDRALAEKQATVHHDADAVVQRARQDADAVLDLARDKADQHLAEAAPAGGARDTVERERAIADDAVRDERAIADETLRAERAEQALAFELLLPHERQKTDRYLSSERVTSDDAVAHRDDFLGIVSHDLRNLLAGIVLSSSVIAQGAKESNPAKVLAETSRIKRRAAQMNRLIGDLMDVASIDSGNLGIMVGSGDAGALVTEAMDTFRDLAQESGIGLEARLPGQPLLAEFDHDRILQALGNLLSNALKFTPRGGRIVISAESRGPLLAFVVQDDGPGIPAGMLTAVFNRFTQVGKRDRRGLGLGLHIAKSIVEAHHGTIWVESEGQGQGSRFCFSFPKVLPHATPAPRPAAS